MRLMFSIFLNYSFVCHPLTDTNIHISTYQIHLSENGKEKAEKQENEENENRIFMIMKNYYHLVVRIFSKKETCGNKNFFEKWKKMWRAFTLKAFFVNSAIHLLCWHKKNFFISILCDDVWCFGAIVMKIESYRLNSFGVL